MIRDCNDAKNIRIEVNDEIGILIGTELTIIIITTCASNTQQATIRYSLDSGI